MRNTEINALLQLLLDDDPSIRIQVETRLRGLGPLGLEALEEATLSDHARLRVRARAFLRRLRSGEAMDELASILKGESPDLESATIALAKTENPDLDPNEITQPLERMGRILASRLEPGATLEQKASELSRLLFEEEHFRGNSENYYDPRNSFLDDVLRRRVGIPISLCTVTILVGRRAGLTVRGVGMPMHFLVQVEDSNQSLVLDPFGGGRILTRENCRTLLAGYNHALREEYLRPVSDRLLMHRVLSNLVQIYKSRNDTVRVERIQALRSGLPGLAS